MKYTATLSAILIASAFMTPGVSFAQGKPQTLALTKVDTQSLATGYRASKVIGASVVNDSNDKVGTVDDLIVAQNGKVPYAILSVGGFLGVGSKYVALPASDLEYSDSKVTLHNATKDSLMALPAFTYAK